METPLDPPDVVQVHTKAENHKETPGTMQMMSQSKMKQKTTEKLPDFLGKTGIVIEFIQEVNLHPNRSDILGKRKYSSSYLELLQLKISSDCTSLRKLLIMLLLKHISVQGSTLKQKRTTSGLILHLKIGNQVTGLKC